MLQIILVVLVSILVADLAFRLRSVPFYVFCWLLGINDRKKATEWNKEKLKNATCRHGIDLNLECPICNSDKIIYRKP